MGPVVIEDQMNFLSPWHRTLNLLQEVHEFLVSVSWLALSNHGPVQDVQRGKQRRSAISFVVMCLAFRDARSHREQRLGPIERLDLALLIHAQHQSFIGWIQVQSDNIPNLLAESWIFAELELLHTVRLQSVKLPDAIHSRVANALDRRHSPCTPMRCVCWLGFQCRLYDRLLLLLTYDLLPPTPLPIFPNPF